MPGWEVIEKSDVIAHLGNGNMIKIVNLETNFIIECNSLLLGDIVKMISDDEYFFVEQTETVSSTITE